MNIGLVLEGGGMRGTYTGGILQYFMEQNLHIPYVIGVSAGACQGTSYISKQKMRNKVVTVDYVDHPEYISLKNLVKKRELFGMDFIFHDLPMTYEPFDFEEFRNSEQQFVIGVTECETGQPLYYEKSELNDEELLTILRASSSLPYMAPKVAFKGKHLLDGGISDPIPLKKSEQDGNKRNIIILTRNQGYRKSKPHARWLVKNTNRQHKELADSLLHRYQKYNETIDYIEEQERLGNVFVIRPTEPLEVGRIERNKEKLEALYKHGYEEAEKQYDALVEWMQG